MKPRYLGLLLILLILILSGCKDKPVPMERSTDIDTTGQDDTSVLDDADKKIKKYRDKAEDYVSTDIDSVIDKQNQAMDAVKKARKAKSDQEQADILTNDAIPKAKQAVKKAKALQGKANLDDLDKLQKELVDPLTTFVNLLEAKTDLLTAQSKHLANKAKHDIKDASGRYIEEMNNFYDHLHDVADHYNLQLDWDDFKALSDHIDKQLDIAEDLHLAKDQFHDLLNLQQDTINTLQKLLKQDNSAKKPDDNDDLSADLKNLFPNFADIFNDDNNGNSNGDGDSVKNDKHNSEDNLDWTKHMNDKQISESLDTLKQATHKQLDALKAHDHSMNKTDKKQIDKAHKKIKQSQRDLNQLHDDLKKIKSELSDDH